MRYIFLLVFAFTTQITAIQATERSGFSVRKDVAQYKGSDYANVIQVERNIPLEKAFEIAENNPDIDYFVYMKGCQMVLEIPPDVQFNPNNDPFELASNIDFIYDSGELGSGYCRVFGHGDVVFFKEAGIWLGSAPGLADTYFKTK